MKSLIGALLLAISSFATADDYRYCGRVCTGLQETVVDALGKRTTIIFSKDSNPEAQFLLENLLNEGRIHGTPGMQKWHGVLFEQAILIKGTLHSKVQRTPCLPNRAAAEDYQEFTLEKVMVRFPLMMIAEGEQFDTGYVETHISFATLFPKGLVFEGRKIDLDKHTAKAESDEKVEAAPAPPESPPPGNPDK